MLFITTISEKHNLQNQDNVLDSLLICIAKNDKEALAMLYHQTKTAVYSFALSILRNKADAEDVMQDVYVKIYVSAKAYRTQGKPMAWILTITRNQSLMKLRENKKTELFLHEQQDISDSYDAIADSINRLMLEAVMTILTDEERQIVILHGISGQKHREIAKIINLPLSTVLSKYRRALSKLKKHLKEDSSHD